MAERKRYVHLFETVSDFNAAYEGEDYHEPWVSYVKENERVDYNKPKEYDKEYLTFNMLESGEVFWEADEESPAEYCTIQYSLNGGGWSAITSSYGEAPSISVNEGDVLRFKGQNTAYRTETICQNKFSSDAAFNVEGNIMSLFYGDNFKGQTVLPARPEGGEEASNLGKIFGGCPVVDASNLVLPATTLTENCYAHMFEGCTGLTKAPELPAATLVFHCYRLMFSGCTSLNHIKCLATNISADECLDSWVSGVASSGTFVKAASTTGWPTGVDGIPNNWTVQNA